MKLTSVNYLNYKSIEKTMQIHPHLELNHEYNLKLAEFIGILLGDGCLSHYTYNKNNQIRHHYRIKITLNSIDDLDYINYVVNLCNYLFGIEPRLHFRKDTNAVDILIFNKSILNFLINEIGLHLSPKWNRATIPDKFCKNQLGRKVLRGYFDTDGCITLMNNNGTRYPRLEMKISPSPMQTQLIDILQENGFRYRIYPLDKGKVTIHICGINELIKWQNQIGFSNKKNILRANLFFKKE